MLVYRISLIAAHWSTVGSLTHIMCRPATDRKDVRTVIVEMTRAAEAAPV